MAYEVRVLADAVMAGLPWMLLTAGRNERVLCITESVMGRPAEERLRLLEDVLDGVGFLPVQRAPES